GRAPYATRNPGQPTSGCIRTQTRLRERGAAPQRKARVLRFLTVPALRVLNPPQKIKRILEGSSRCLRPSNPNLRPTGCRANTRVLRAHQRCQVPAHLGGK